VGPDGNAWVVNSGHTIFHYSGSGWVSSPGAANEIAVATDGTPWVIGTIATGGGYYIYRWNGSNWVNVPGGAVHIAAGPVGNPWVINSAHQIYASSTI
jgi:hypothetical protein